MNNVNICILFAGANKVSRHGGERGPSRDHRWTTTDRREGPGREGVGCARSRHLRSAERLTASGAGTLRSGASDALYVPGLLLTGEFGRGATHLWGPEQDAVHERCDGDEEQAELWQQIRVVDERSTATHVHVDGRIEPATSTHRTHGRRSFTPSKVHRHRRILKEYIRFIKQESIDRRQFSTPSRSTATISERRQQCSECAADAAATTVWFSSASSPSTSVCCGPSTDCDCECCLCSAPLSSTGPRGRRAGTRRSQSHSRRRGRADLPGKQSQLSVRPLYID